MIYYDYVLRKGCLNTDRMIKTDIQLNKVHYKSILISKNMESNIYICNQGEKIWINLYTIYKAILFFMILTTPLYGILLNNIVQSISSENICSNFLQQSNTLKSSHFQWIISIGKYVKPNIIFLKIKLYFWHWIVPLCSIIYHSWVIDENCHVDKFTIRYKFITD